MKICVCACNSMTHKNRTQKMENKKNFNQISFDTFAHYSEDFITITSTTLLHSIISLHLFVISMSSSLASSSSSHVCFPTQLIYMCDFSFSLSLPACHIYRLVCSGCVLANGSYQKENSCAADFLDFYKNLGGPE